MYPISKAFAAEAENAGQADLDALENMQTSNYDGLKYFEQQLTLLLTLKSKKRHSHVSN